MVKRSLIVYYDISIGWTFGVYDPDEPTKGGGLGGSLPGHLCPEEVARHMFRVFDYLKEANACELVDTLEEVQKKCQVARYIVLNDGGAKKWADSLAHHFLAGKM